MKNKLFFFLFMTLGATGLLPAQDASNDRGANGRADTLPILQRTMAGVRSSAVISASGKSYYITDPGRQGQFTGDPVDKASPDDSAMILVTAGGLRLKRMTDQRMLNVQWFGATGNGSTDDWYAIQKGITYILNNNTAARVLYFPAGNYRISRPLIITRFKGSSYDHSAITLSGPSN